jgi:hypothetical protein
MFGCIGKIVVLAVLIVLGAVAYLSRGAWEPRLREKMGWTPKAAAVAPTWEPLTSAGATRARMAIASFRRPAGPVFVNTSAADLASLALEPLMRGLSAAGDSTARPEALAGENVISLRGNIRMADLGGAAALGPLAGVLEGTQRIEVRGRPVVVSPGTARFIVERIALGNLALPSAAIGRVVQRIAPRTDASAPAEAIALAVPRDVADIRVTGGRVTLYKAVP